MCISQSFLEASPEQITEVVQTNLLGTLLCTRAAMQALGAQARGGHIFNMDGAGANNLPSPMYAAYGATKAGMSLAALADLFSLSHGSATFIHGWHWSQHSVLAHVYPRMATPVLVHVAKGACAQGLHT
jgi:hypothetical protein